ncbi:hypothetical protein Tco_0451059 [Tanacetum coccineum]
MNLRMMKSLTLKRAIGEKEMRKKISSKEVVFTKSDVSTFETSPAIPSDSESEETQRQLQTQLRTIHHLPLNQEVLSLPKAKVRYGLDLVDTDYLKRYVWYLDGDCSRHMTWVKQYLHRYSKESGPKVVFGDNSSGDTEGYGSMNYNGITFIRIACVNGLKHNLISISQLCDANFKVLFTKKLKWNRIQGQNNEVLSSILQGEE